MAAAEGSSSWHMCTYLCAFELTEGLAGIMGHLAKQEAAEAANAAEAAAAGSR
jgi:hypothetical protein